MRPLSTPHAAQAKAPSNGAARKPRKLPKTLTAEQAKQLLSMPNLATPTGLRDRCVLELMYRCGLRATECCRLALRDVDWSAGEIRIRAEVGKGGKEAVVYLDGPTLELLRRWKEVRRSYGAGRPHLFVCVRGEQRGEPLNRHGLYKMVVRRARKAGIEQRVWLHMLRHSFATSALEDGFNIREVQELMRHSDLSTTSIYLHVRDEQLREKIRRRGEQR